MLREMYVWFLNAIRQGYSQVESWNLGKSRFPGATPADLQKAWGGAWSGLGVAEFAKLSPGSTVHDIIFEKQPVELIGGREYTFDQLRTAFQAVVDTPWDFNMLINVINGPTSYYDQRRWLLREGDTYASITETTKGLMLREYKLGPDAHIHFVRSYLIGIM